MGYHRAGFDVTGVDIKRQRRYPFSFVQGDALEYLKAHGREFDAIHASPPCQGYSEATFLQGTSHLHPKLIDETRKILSDLGRPWVIENVSGAWREMPDAIELCGLSFGLKVFRHRLFASNLLLLAPAHTAHGNRRIGHDGYCSVAGEGYFRKVHNGKIEEKYDPIYTRRATWSAAMGIDWMTRGELAQAIPPAYTRYIGEQLIRAC